MKKIPLPTKSQLNNYLARLWSENLGQWTIHLDELEKLLIENSAATEKEPGVFLIGYDSDMITYDTKAFKVFISSIILGCPKSNPLFYVILI